MSEGPSAWPAWGTPLHGHRRPAGRSSLTLHHPALTPRILCSRLAVVTPPTGHISPWPLHMVFPLPGIILPSVHPRLPLTSPSCLVHVFAPFRLNRA